jgi:hypothetical protein
MNMFYRQLSIIAIAFLLILTSCFEKDKRVMPYPGEVFTINDNIEKYQSYFDFETGNLVLSQPSDAWQLGFECGPNGWHILVNSGAQWLIYNTYQTDFDTSMTLPSNAIWAYDKQSNYPDSTAVGKWVSFNGNLKEYSKNAYILGKYSGSGYAELKQIVFFNLTDSSYQFYYHKKNVDFSDTVTILKNDTANYVYYSFGDKQQVNLEPNKSSYDIVFGPYYDLATEFGVTIPYLVRGVLLNVHQTSALLDSVDTYDQIEFASLGNLNFLAQRDVIGYRWKDVNVDVAGGSAVYTVKSNYTYVVHTAQDNYFKIHFLGYMLKGNSGYPQFEYLLLK